MDQLSSTNEDQDVWVLQCNYEPEHTHEYPGDWQFGGADGLDPRTDARYEPSTYTYFDDRLRAVHITQAPLCDDQALDEFTKVAGFGPDYHPVWLTVRRPGERTPETLPFTYDLASDTIFDKE